MDFEEFLNIDYPLPDPSWDYIKIYHNCHRVRIKLENLIEYMSQVENATPETDSEIKARLDEIGQGLNRTRRIVDEG